MSFNGIAGLARGVIETLLPPACLACGYSLSPRFEGSRFALDLLCGDCRALLRPLDQEKACPRCGLSPHRPPSHPSPGCSDCERLPLTFHTAHSSFSYLSPAGQIVRNMKYRNAPYLAKWLAELTWPYSGKWLQDVSEEAIVVPVPMYPWRELRRGYNQARELAIAIAAKLERPVISADVLIRSQATRPQARFHSREQRLENLEECFRITDPVPIRGRTIVLVDDVMTTGATIAHAAGALLEAGSGRIYAFTPVRARLGDDREEMGEK